MPANKVNILGVRIDPVRVEDVLDRIREHIHHNQRAIITHVNVMGLNLAYEQEWFRSFLNHSSLVYCDGMGVLLAARLLGSPLSQRLTLADWIIELATFAQKEGFSLFFLGNPPGVAERAAECLKTHFPALQVCGSCHGYFNKTIDNPENEAVIAQINSADPDILLVGFGMPAQEKWLLENWDRIDTKVAITVGAIFEYITGDLKRGPKWMTQNYLEWLFRLADKPNRYAIRYLRDNPLFLLRLVKQILFGLPAGKSTHNR